MTVVAPNPPPFPDGIKLAPGWWKSRNGMIFNIARSQDDKFVNVNPDGLVDPGGALFVWYPDGINASTPISDGEADQDFALVERVGVSSQPLPVSGSFVVAIFTDPTDKDGWRVATYREGVPGDIWNHVEGERE